jgi:hypothetical protein
MLFQSFFAVALEKTFSIKQQSVLPEVDVLSSSKAFDMKLPGPS